MDAARLDSFLADRDTWRTTHCSIAKAMDIVGTRSAVLILREAYYGTTRFDDFAQRVGITEAVAAARLRKLTTEGLFERSPYREPGQRTRYEYVLTEKGRDLLPAVLALMQWGDKYLQADYGPPLALSDDATGDPVRVEVRSPDREVPLRDLRLTPNFTEEEAHRRHL
ncbi:MULTISPECIES: helix-turn-helix domain-containing protein [unclassified Rhodococcus (in: high G+C Gram-positive bacteria)]|uniref:winged helix-turn-helix transcriptional regulator n=1 Tax=unclassified Rhodococcus (in: high G+C Gram-positive bacteria) TaxID=192944 RepID=UPI00163AC538|nr:MULTISPECIES: helix-turn-helix domain-containing protein [unclassified Rhodococcus (in: high G+C Gram-positive bacteria)]MBC2642812.1 helix-turn-helix transcriptional regulator [Rhodococcus sp. 3A]MBC2892446.1 helix-turn-helix transcriptional regulator [Rhodococcus sp. 4CII]